MTANNKLKRRARERAAKTGESYQVARRQLLAHRAGPLPTTEHHDESVAVATKPHWSTLRAFTAPPPAALTEGIAAAGDAIRAFNAKVTGKPVEPAPAPPTTPREAVESSGEARLADMLRWRRGQGWLTWPVQFRDSTGLVVTRPDAVDWSGFSETDAQIAEIHRTGDIARRMAEGLARLQARPT